MNLLVFYDISDIIPEGFVLALVALCQLRAIQCIQVVNNGSLYSSELGRDFDGISDHSGFITITPSDLRVVSSFQDHQ